MNLLRRLGIREGSAVLDVGFGHADDLVALSKIVGPKGTVVGVERSRRSIRKGRDRIRMMSNVRILRGDATRIPLPDRHVDHVILKGVLHETRDVIKALREARRLLRAGGSVSVIDFNEFPREWLRRSNLIWRLSRPWRVFGAPLDKHPGFSRGEIEAHFESSGLRLEDYRASFGEGYFSGHEVTLFLAVSRYA